MIIDTSRLKSQLLTSGIQQQNAALFQVIDQLIKVFDKLQITISSLPSGGTITNITNVTEFSPIPGIQGEDGNDGEMGPPGNQGLTGNTGNTGPTGPLTIGPMGLDGLDGEDGYPIPGNVGATGAQGIQGPEGPVTIGPMGIDGYDGEDGYPIPNTDKFKWEFLYTQTAAGATNYDFINLAKYSEIRVILIAVTLSSSGRAQLRVSIDNGATFLAASGDYIGISGAGVATNTDNVDFYSTNATAARYGEILIEGFNMSNQKITRSNLFSTDSVNLKLIPTTTPLNAVRVFATAGNLSGGTILVFGR